MEKGGQCAFLKVLLMAFHLTFFCQILDKIVLCHMLIAEGLGPKYAWLWKFLLNISATCAAYTVWCEALGRWIWIYLHYRTLLLLQLKIPVHILYLMCEVATSTMPVTWSLVSITFRFFCSNSDSMLFLCSHFAFLCSHFDRLHFRFYLSICLSIYPSCTCS